MHFLKNDRSLEEQGTAAGRASGATAMMRQSIWSDAAILTISPATIWRS